MINGLRNIATLRSDGLRKIIEARLRSESQEFIPRKTRIKYGAPAFDVSEIVEVVNSLIDGRLAIGTRNRRFEQKLARYIGSHDCVTVNSGSSALLLAFRCLLEREIGALKEGDEVIVPALCHPADLNALILNGLKPVVVDVEFGTWNLSCEEVERALSPRTKAILAIHFLGNPCEMRILSEISETNSLKIIEDCSQALGSRYSGKHLGCFGELATFSFYPSHHISMGEGGAVTYNDERYDDALRSLRSWGAIGQMYDPKYQRPVTPTDLSREDNPWAGRFVFPRVGFNLKITEMQAAFGIIQLQKLERFNKIRRTNFNKIIRHLEKYNHFLALPQTISYADPVWFAVGVVVKRNAPFPPKMLIRHLDSSGIETRPFLAGDAIQQAAYSDAEFRTIGKRENTAVAAERGFFFGCHQGMNSAMVDYVTDCFDAFLKNTK